MTKQDFIPAYIALGLLFLTIIVGSVGFVIIEGYELHEAVYMTIITIATVGFREVKPLSSQGMWFTSFLIIFSFGLFAYAVSTFTKFVVDGVTRNYFKARKMQKTIDKLKGHVIVCGMGRNGYQAAQELIDHKISFVIIEKDENVVQNIQKEMDYLIIQGDATQDNVLLSANIKNARALITALPADADNLYVVLSAKELNPGLKIITRASDDNSDNKLRTAGAQSVIMPDRVGGRRMAKLVAQPDVVEFMEYILMQAKGNIFLEEVFCEKFIPTFNGKTINELNVRSLSGANIIGLKREDNTFLVNPSPNETITAKDKMFVLGSKDQIEKLKHILRAGSI